MADVKWIKITTDMFDNRKIRHLRRLPEGNNIVLIWVMLLTMAGRCNAGGMIFLTENIPYNTKMLADELDFEENTVRLALEALERFGMICTDGNLLAIAGWEEHQNIEGMERIREQNRLRKAAQRERQKQLPVSRDSHGTVTQGHATDIDKEEDKDIDRDIEERNSGATVPPPSLTVPYESIKNLYNEICKSFPRCNALSDSRKKAIKARFVSGYTEEDFKTLFRKAEASSFLRGSNNRNWTANFDWLIKDANMAKVLDGNYDEKANGNAVAQTGRTTVEQEAMKRMQKYREEMDRKKTAGNDPDIRARAEELKRKVVGGLV